MIREFRRLAPARGLSTDLSANPADMLPGDDWLEFLLPEASFRFAEDSPLAPDHAAIPDRKRYRRGAVDELAAAHPGRQKRMNRR